MDQIYTLCSLMKIFSVRVDCGKELGMGNTYKPVSVRIQDQEKETKTILVRFDTREMETIALQTIRIFVKKFVAQGNIETVPVLRSIQRIVQCESIGNA